MEKLIMLSQAAINLLIHNEYATSWLVMSCSRFNNYDTMKKMMMAKQTNVAAAATAKSE